MSTLSDTVAQIERERDTYKAEASRLRADLDVLKQAVYLRAVTVSTVDVEALAAHFTSTAAERASFIAYAERYTHIASLPELTKAVEQALVPDGTLIDSTIWSWLHSDNQLQRAARAVVGIIGARIVKEGAQK